MQSAGRNIIRHECLICLIILLSCLCTSCSRKKHTHGQLEFSRIQDKTSKWLRPKSDTDSLSFIVVGDWGRDGKEYQQAVADQMDIYARKFHVQFIISTGDNFYENGVRSIADPRWKTSFEDIYNKPGHRVTWYAILGNHDYNTNPQAEVDYTALNGRWKMPSRYYSMEKKIDNGHKAFFVFTDTSPFERDYYKSAKGDLQKQDTTAQLAWLQKKLIETKDTWKIAIGHHPVYSGGRHGNTPELIADFAPIFLQSNTDFYLCGHDHTLEYLVGPKGSVHYLISGGDQKALPLMATHLVILQQLHLAS